MLRQLRSQRPQLFPNRVQIERRGRAVSRDRTDATVQQLLELGDAFPDFLVAESHAVGLWCACVSCYPQNPAYGLFPVGTAVFLRSINAALAAGTTASASPDDVRVGLAVARIDAGELHHTHIAVRLAVRRAAFRALAGIGFGNDLLGARTGRPAWGLGPFCCCFLRHFRAPHVASELTRFLVRRDLTTFLGRCSAKLTPSAAATTAALTRQSQRWLSG